MLVAIFCVGLLFRIVPNVGDEIAGAVTARRELKAGTPNSPLPSAGNVVRQSIQTHLVPRPLDGRRGRWRPGRRAAGGAAPRRHTAPAAASVAAGSAAAVARRPTAAPAHASVDRA